MNKDIGFDIWNCSNYSKEYQYNFDNKAHSIHIIHLYQPKGKDILFIIRNDLILVLNLISRWWS